MAQLAMFFVDGWDRAAWRCHTGTRTCTKMTAGDEMIAAGGREYADVTASSAACGWKILEVRFD